MLQFYDQIVSKKGFIDLHIHTNDSYGDEMDKMELTPEELLESCLLYSKNNADAPVTFAITDHNSVDGVQKVDLLIKSDPLKYKNIHLITGCEFTCSAGSFGTYIDAKNHIKNIFQNFHMLAYNFNPFDDDLQFLCKLHSTRKDNSVFYTSEKTGKTLKISAGAYVLAIKNIMKDYGYNYPISEFKDVNLKTRNLSEQTYINYLMNYIKKFNLPIDITNDIKRQLQSRNIMHLGRLDCMEIMQIVEKAGGVCVLAHPKLLAYSTHLPNSKETKMFLESLLKEKNIEFRENEALYSIITKYFVYKLTTEAIHPITHEKLNGIVGMEVLHSTGTDKDSILKNLTYIARKNDLYITGGSDSHGSLIKDCMLSDFTPKNIKNFGNHKNNIVMVNNLFAQNILSGKIKTEKTCKISSSDQVKILKTNKENGEFKEQELTIGDLVELLKAKHTKKPEKILTKEEKEKLNQERLAKEHARKKQLEKPVRELIIKINKINKEMANFLLADNLNKEVTKDYIKSFIYERTSLNLLLRQVSKYTEELSNYGSAALNYLVSLIDDFNHLKNEINKKFNTNISKMFLQNSLTQKENSKQKKAKKLISKQEIIKDMELKAQNFLNNFSSLISALSNLTNSDFSFLKAKEEFNKTKEIRKNFLNELKTLQNYKIKDRERSLNICKIVIAEEEFNKICQNLNDKYNVNYFNFLTGINPLTLEDDNTL
mgnify:CR=1 FL=1